MTTHRKLIEVALPLEAINEASAREKSISQFAVGWFEQFRFNEGEFGQADVLARAKNTSATGVSAAGIVEAGRGRVKLRPPAEYDVGAFDPSWNGLATVWEAAYYFIKRLTDHGEKNAAEPLVKLPGDLGSQARELTYRLYNICERKGWADLGFDYNALVISWPAIQEEANKLRQDAQRPPQMGLGLEK